jgi:16S rRNA (cytidine1402-2'-O)-methyltransferase
VFLGFLPRAGEERREAVARVRASEEAVVLFEAPFRMTALLEDLAEAMPAREAAVGRELTKVHEEFLRGTLKELAEEAKSREWLGELTVVLGPMEGGAPEPEAVDLDARIDEELAKGRRPKEIAEAMAMATGRPRREIYARVLARRG